MKAINKTLGKKVSRLVKYKGFHAYVYFCSLLKQNNKEWGRGVLKKHTHRSEDVAWRYQAWR